MSCTFRYQPKRSTTYLNLLSTIMLVRSIEFVKGNCVTVLLIIYTCAEIIRVKSLRVSKCTKGNSPRFK